MKISKLFVRAAAIAAFASAAICSQAQINTWVYKAHMLDARAQEATAVGTDGKIYLFGGTDGKAYLTSAESYDPATDTWSPISDVPSAPGEAAVGLPDGRILLIAQNSSVYAYHPDTDSYTTLATFSNAADIFRAAIGNDGKVYGIAKNISYAYDISSDTWSTVGPAPTDIGYLPGVAADANGLIYVVGGALGSSETPQMNGYTLNGHANAWSPLPDMNHARSYFAAACGGDGRIYAIGSELHPGADPTVEVYDTTAGSWSFVASLQTPRAEFGAATDQKGRIYVFGGFSDFGAADNTVLNTVECYQPSLLLGSGDKFAPQEGTSFSGEVATIRDKDLSQSALNFTASIDWGDGSAPTTASVAADVQSGKYLVNGNHTYAEDGTYPTTIKVTDSDGESLTMTGEADVTDAPVSGSSINFTAYTNVLFTGIVGKFSDDNALSDASDFKISMSWGDVSPGTVPTLSPDPSGGFDLTSSHTYTTPGTYNFSIRVADDNGLGSFVILKGVATVTAPPPAITATSINAVEGGTFNGQVATFTDADPNYAAADYSATIDWGDGSTSGGNVAASGGGFAVTGNHVYAEEGRYAIIITITVGGATGSGIGVATVADAPLTATGFDLVCKGQNFSNTVAAFTDADINGTASDYSAAIFWGDGKSSNGTIVAGGSGWKVVGSHYYAKRGKYTVTITIRDAGGASTSATTHITVGPVK